jgi:predicted glycosyltransferase
MRVVVTIQHAGHVHFFKHAIAALEADGHDVFVFARENAMSTALLDRCGIEYELLAGESDSLVSLARAQCVYEARLLGRAREIQPDVMTAVGGVAVSHVASLVGARSVVFYDTEHASIIRNLSFPFADVICTPACFEADLGDNHHRYPGYHELAYLHPDRFTPDPDVREAVGVAPDDRFVVLRLGDWGPHTTSARAGSTTTGPSSSDWRPPGRRSASPPKATSTTTCASTSYRSSPNASTTCWPRPTSTSARARRPRPNAPSSGHRRCT